MMQGTGQRDAWIANNLVFPMYIYSVNDIKYQPLFDGLTDYWRPVDAANGDYTAVNPNAKYPRMYGQNPTVGSNYGRRQINIYLMPLTSASRTLLCRIPFLKHGYPESA